MENISFEIPKNKDNQKRVEGESPKLFNPEMELSRPNLRIVNDTKRELGKLFNFGLKSINEAGDAELLNEIDRHFFTNRGKMENMAIQWRTALSDVNKNAKLTEETLAQNFAKTIFEFITTESKLKDKYNN